MIRLICGKLYRRSRRLDGWRRGQRRQVIHGETVLLAVATRNQHQSIAALDYATGFERGVK